LFLHARAFFRLRSIRDFAIAEARLSVLRCGGLSLNVYSKSKIGVNCRIESGTDNYGEEAQ
jgi:hypothetical protein